MRRQRAAFEIQINILLLVNIVYFSIKKYKRSLRAEHGRVVLVKKLKKNRRVVDFVEVGKTLFSRAFFVFVQLHKTDIFYHIEYIFDIYIFNF